ncbi:MAG: selenocysteine-specific translation elongation factor, partial [Planctomycetes bacterium]|nr:selenocysteine-specific translation elongation factor [Planctomycetota bacterium]
MALKLKTPELLPLMAGTAGHVDHGKSALVKLLTGCEMDRHPEAKLRGLTIDLGFAPLRLPGNRMLGIIDVPGHEDFIRNMVAGAASMDILMLIVAADDGIMPQTLEHLRIAKTLSTPRVMAVISKIDLVSPEKLALVRQEVKAFLAALGIVDSPIVAVSNITLDGLEEVRQTLQEMVEGIAERSDPRAFRMYVERVFSVKGYGTIVAGIPITGELQVGDEVQLLPGGSIHPVRAIQSYKFGVNTATPKVCAAINLRGLEVKDAHRGMTLAAPGIYQPTDSAIIRFTSEHEKQILKRVTRVKFHSGTNAVNASLKLLSEEKLGYRETCYAQVSFAEPAVLASGDRYIIRSLSPVDTIGGGVILSTRTHRLRRSELGLLDRLQQAASAVKEGDFFASELLAGSQAIVSNAQALNLTQCSGQTAEKRIKDAIASGLLYDLGGGALLVKERLGEVH